MDPMTSDLAEGRTLRLPDGSRLVANDLHVDIHQAGNHVSIEAADVDAVAQWLAMLTRGAVIYEDGTMHGVDAVYATAPNEQTDAARERDLRPEAT